MHSANESFMLYTRGKSAKSSTAPQTKPKPFVSRVRTAHDPFVFQRDNSVYSPYALSADEQRHQHEKAQRLIASGRDPPHGFYWTQRMLDDSMHRMILTFDILDETELYL